MSGKLVVVLVVVLIVLLGIWLSIPNDKSDKAVWPSDTCSAFFGGTKAASVLCDFIEILVANNSN